MNKFFMFQLVRYNGDTGWEIIAIYPRTGIEIRKGKIRKFVSWDYIDKVKPHGSE